MRPPQSEQAHLKIVFNWKQLSRIVVTLSPINVWSEMQPLNENWVKVSTLLIWMIRRLLHESKQWQEAPNEVNLSNVSDFKAVYLKQYAPFITWDGRLLIIIMRNLKIHNATFVFQNTLLLITWTFGIETVSSNEHDWNAFGLIGLYAFSVCNDLTTLILPSVTSLGNSLFSDNKIFIHIEFDSANWWSCFFIHKIERS